MRRSSLRSEHVPDPRIVARRATCAGDVRCAISRPRHTDFGQAAVNGKGSRNTGRASARLLTAGGRWERLAARSGLEISACACSLRNHDRAEISVRALDLIVYLRSVPPAPSFELSCVAFIDTQRRSGRPVDAHQTLHRGREFGSMAFRNNRCCFICRRASRGNMQG